MKISKVLAGFSALAVASAMAVTAAASDYMYTPKTSWNGNTETDLVESVIKFTEDTTAKGASEFNQWNTGSVKYNGAWCQYILTDNDLSGITITVTVESTADTVWETHDYDEDKSADDQQYEVFRMMGGYSCEFTPYDTITQVGSNNDMASTYVGSFTYTYNGDDIQAAIDAGLVEFGSNGDDEDTYTLGFNVQVGHCAYALLTIEIESSTGNLYGEQDNTDSTGSTSSDDSTSSTDSTGSGSDSSATSSTTTSSGTSSSASKSGSTTTTSGTSTTTSTSASTSDDTTAEAGVGAGLGLAVAALAGAAIVVSRKNR